MKSLELTNLLTIVEDNVLVNGLLFKNQTQWNYDRKECVPGYIAGNNITEVWTYISSLFSGITIDSVNYPFAITVDLTNTATLQTFLNGLNKGTFTVTSALVLGNIIVTIRGAHTSLQGVVYDIYGTLDSLNTVKTVTPFKTYQCCEEGCYYIIIVDEIEYWIPEVNVALTNVINGPFLGQSVYSEKLASEWPDKEEKDMLHLCENEVLKKANIVIDAKVR